MLFTSAAFQLMLFTRLCRMFVQTLCTHKAGLLAQVCGPFAWPEKKLHTVCTPCMIRSHTGTANTQMNEHKESYCVKLRYF